MSQCNKGKILCGPEILKARPHTRRCTRGCLDPKNFLVALSHGDDSQKLLVAVLKEKKKSTLILVNALKKIPKEKKIDYSTLKKNSHRNKNRL